jgi:hypothetical protein
MGWNNHTQDRSGENRSWKDILQMNERRDCTWNNHTRDRSGENGSWKDEERVLPRSGFQIEIERNVTNNDM